MKKNKVFIACDTTSTSKVKKIIKDTKTNRLKVGYKFGLEFLNSKNGRQYISKLKNKITFGDYKISDILTLLTQRTYLMLKTQLFHPPRHTIRHMNSISTIYINTNNIEYFH